MANEQNEGAAQATSITPAIGLSGRIQERYKKLKEHAVAYPFVWGSYAVVYGGFGLYVLHRWQKLRKMEDKIRGLQNRLRKLVEAEEAAGKSAVTAQKKPSPSAAVESNATK